MKTIPSLIRPIWRQAALFGLAGVMSLGLLTADMSAPRAALATTSGSQSDPAWDFGRGGVEMPGQPACYVPAPSVTERRMYNMNRPSCTPYHMQ